MTVIYNRIQNNFTQVSNLAGLDSNLSAKAFKLYWYMCYRIGTCPTWQFNKTEILKHFKEGEKALRVAFNELIDAGFLVRKQSRNEGGKFGSLDYEIFAEPINTDSTPQAQNRRADNRQAEKGQAENALHNNKEVINKELSNKENTNKEKEEFLNKFKKGTDIIQRLHPDAKKLAKSNAPEWDLYYLADIYISGIKDDLREPPRLLDKAFPSWCKCYTKGKTP
jgi:hypothetical protein